MVQAERAVALVDKSAIKPGARIDLLSEVRLFDLLGLLGEATRPGRVRPIQRPMDLRVNRLPALFVGTDRRYYVAALEVNLEILFARNAFERGLERLLASSLIVPAVLV